MDDGVGELGFWLMIGMVCAAAIVSDGIKERDKERERQATLRALLGNDGDSTAQVLAYMRERDAEDAANMVRARARSAALWVKLKAVALGLLAIPVGLVAFGALRRLLLGGGPESVIIPVVPMLVIWVLGYFNARRVWRSANLKHDTAPDA